MRIHSVFIAFLFLATTQSVAQDMTYFYVEAEGFTVKQDELQNANTLAEIHPRYENDWVKTYISTEIQYSKNEFVISAKGKNNVLSTSQKELLNHAKVNGLIKVIVDYIPKNSLSSNTPKQMEFFFHVVPQKPASFKDGEEAFYKYIDKNIASTLDPTERKLVVLSIFDFTVSTEGKIENVVLVEGTGNIELDAFLQQGLCDSPSWNPAESTTGIPVEHCMRFYFSNSVSNCLAYRGISKK